MAAKRVLVCGDVDGDLERVYSDVVKQEAVHGKFDLLFAVGKFLPANQTKGSGLHAYVSGEKVAPIKTYFIDSASGIFCSSAAQGRTLGKTTIEYLGAYGVKEIEGLKVGFLSGRQPPPERYDEEYTFPDGKPKHTGEGFYTRSIISHMKNLAGPIDLLLTGEWPADLNNNVVKEETFEPAADAGITSLAVAEIAAALEPRFHIFGLANRFYRRQPYQARSGHVCRPVGLGKVGEKGKEKKALHALIIVPFSHCKPEGLMRGVEDATLCPYEDESAEANIQRKRRRATLMMPQTKLVKVENAPPGHAIRQEKGKWVLQINFGEGRSFTIETGEVARHAAGSVMICDGGTRVLCSASAKKAPSDSNDLLLHIEYRERTSAIGMIPGGFFKRDSPIPADHEVLVSRLADRPLRPMFLETWNFETQVLMFVMSYDEVNPPESLAICGASAALCLSDIPLKRPVAAVTVALSQDDSFIVNPTIEERKASKMHITCAGNSDAVSMIEASADFVVEDQFYDAVLIAHNAVKIICAGLHEFVKKVGKEKRDAAHAPTPPQLAPIVERKYLKKIDAVLRSFKDKSATLHEELISNLEAEAVTELGPAKDGEEKALEFQTKEVRKAFKKLVSIRLLALIQDSGERVDGRKPKDVRGIDIVQRYLPGPHGASLFTRGDTQTIGTCTLGDSSAQQRIESIVDIHRKRFFLQYFFPPFTVSDVNNMEKSRDLSVGHGNVAEMALIPSIPEYELFPYTIRTESLITESCGSSSMASVCGCSLAMVDAGVPVKSLVAGVALGLVDTSTGVSSEDALILSDITEVEDFIGKMDFKVAGNEDGISAVQLDVKNEGITPLILNRALTQAKEARLHILNEMKKALPAGKRELPANVPKILRFKVPLDIKGKIIGPGGSNLRKLITEFHLRNIHLDEDGGVEISSLDEAVNNTVKMIIDDISNADPGRGRPDMFADLPKLIMEIPNAAKGRVIGRGGVTIRSLVEEFELADIKLHEDGKVEITGGDEGNRIACKEKIQSIVAEVRGAGAAGSAGTTLALCNLADDAIDIPKQLIGKIIGKAGANIRELISDYGVHDIKVRQHDDKGTVEIFGGTSHNRESLMDHINSLAAEFEEPMIEGPGAKDYANDPFANSGFVGRPKSRLAFGRSEGHGAQSEPPDTERHRGGSRAGPYDAPAHRYEDAREHRYEEAPQHQYEEVPQHQYEEVPQHQYEDASQHQYEDAHARHYEEAPAHQYEDPHEHPYEDPHAHQYDDAHAPQYEDAHAPQYEDAQTHQYNESERSGVQFVAPVSAKNPSPIFMGLRHAAAVVEKPTRGNEFALPTTRPNTFPPTHQLNRKVPSSKAALNLFSGPGRRNSPERTAPQEQQELKSAAAYKTQVQMELAELCPGDERTYHNLPPFQRRIIQEQADAFQLSCELDIHNNVIVTRPVGEGLY